MSECEERRKEGTIWQVSFKSEPPLFGCSSLLRFFSQSKLSKVWPEKLETSLRIWTRLFKSVFPWVQPWCRKKPSKKKQDQPLWSRIKIKPITNPPPAAVTKIEQEPNASIEWQCFYTQVLVPAKCMESCLEGSPNIYAQAKSDMPNLQRDRRVDGSQNENMTDISCLVLWGQSQRQSDWDGLSESGGGIESSERKCCHAGAEED